MVLVSLLPTKGRNVSRGLGRNVEPFATSLPLCHLVLLKVEPDFTRMFLFPSPAHHPQEPPAPHLRKRRRSVTCGNENSLLTFSSPVSNSPDKRTMYFSRKPDRSGHTGRFCMKSLLSVQLSPPLNLLVTRITSTSVWIRSVPFPGSNTSSCF